MYYTVEPQSSTVVIYYSKQTFVISQKYLATGYNMNAGVVICQADKQKELEVVGTTCWSANPFGTYYIPQQDNAFEE